jgi:hypothetical protein
MSIFDDGKQTLDFEGTYTVEGNKLIEKLKEKSLTHGIEKLTDDEFVRTPAADPSGKTKVTYKRIKEEKKDK